MKGKKLAASLLVLVASGLLNCSAWPLLALVGLASGGSGGGAGGMGFLALLGGGTSANVTRVEVTAANSSIAKGTSTQMTATAVMSNGSTQDVTSSATWSSSNTSVLTVASSGMASSATAATTGSSTVTASYSGFSGTLAVVVTAATIQSLQVTSKTVSVANGYTYQFTATGVFSDNSTQNLSSDPSITWQSSETGTATINATGKATAVSAGAPSTITATYSGKSDTASLTVTAATLVGYAISPTNQSIAELGTLQYTATGTFSDSSTLDLTGASTWNSSNTGTAAVNYSGTTGLIHGENVGSDTNVTIGVANHPTVFTSCATGSPEHSCTTLTVKNCSLISITVTPSNPIAYGTAQQFVATGAYSGGCANQDITQAVTWASSATGVATISNAAGSKGLATSVAAGTTTITATLGVSGNTSLEVRLVTLVSIAIVPSTASKLIGETQAFAATGTYSDGTQMDLTTQVLWASSNTSVAAVSNASPNQGKATGIAAGTATISATRDGVTGSATMTITGDTTAPDVSSVAIDTTTTPASIIVTFSEPVNVTQAGDADNNVSGQTVWKVADSTTLGAGTCAGGDNFSGATQTADFNISSVTTISTTQYRLNLSAGTSAKTYTVLVNNTSGSAGRIRDLASSPNFIGCPNSGNFAGLDQIKPYLVSVTSPTPTTATVTFSEDVKSSGGGGADATVAANWTLIEDDTTANNDTCTDPTGSGVTSVTKVSASVYTLNLNFTQCAIKYRVTATSTITDIAGVPNTMGSPAALQFNGNEQMKLVGAQALTTTTVKLTFSKPLKSDAACSSISACAERYKLPTSLGGVTTAVIGSSPQDNTVTLTHQTAQLGFAYTVIVANNIDGDQFDNTANTFKGIRNSGDTEYVQAASKDRASFTGLGSAITQFSDGSYYEDPFLDGSVFSFAFVHDGKVYLGTNDKNNGAFRFDPSGSNSTLVNFGWAFTPGTCTSATGFGYGAGTTCGTDQGPNGEKGVVGFNAFSQTVTKTGPILYTGILKDAAGTLYYTEDVDTILDYKTASITWTGGGNTKSIQTIYGYLDKVYIGASSDHGTQSPVVAQSTITEASSIFTVGSGSDISLRSLDYIGKNASPDNPCKANNSACVVGIDSMLYVASGAGPTPTDRLYIANNGGIAVSTVQKPTSDANFTPMVNADTGGIWNGTTTLVLPDAPTGLGKLRPGQRGVPFMVVYKGILYAARNLAVGASSANQVLNNGAQLWKCTGTCGTGTNWKLVATASNFSSDSNNLAISLLSVNGGALYIGFDNANGIRVYKTTVAEVNTGNDNTGHSDFTLQFVQGFNNGTPKYNEIISSASASDGTNNYLYTVVRENSSQAIRAFRQID